VAEQQHSGWAENDEPVGGSPFVSDMEPPLGVWVQDMPAPRPPTRKTVIRGLPGATDSDGDQHWKQVQ
jgi:hypothetical protein